MTLTIELPEEVEAELKRQAAEAGVAIETLVEATLRSQFGEKLAARRKPLSHQEFMSKLDEIMSSTHGSGGRLDDSRESIYADSGE
jgi:hypothetical protein